MGAIEARLAALGLSLPPARVFPKPNRRGHVRVGNMLYLSGHGPHHPGMIYKESGKIGDTATLEEGYEAARVVALTMLATLKHAVGDLDQIKQVVRLFGMVNAAPDFGGMPQVIDGASDLFYELYGPEAGCHARTAVGMAALPRGQLVEINGEFELYG